MALLDLPNELLVAIARQLSLGQLCTLVRTNRQCYDVLNLHLYRAGRADTGCLRLYWAIDRDRAGTIENFIKVGTLDDPDDSDHIEKLLKIAAFRGNLDIIKVLVKHGAKVCDCDCMKLLCQNALGEAIRGDQLAVVKFLLDGWADIKGTSTDGQKIIHVAAKYGNEEMMRFFLSRGVELDPLDKDKNSALQIAAMEGNQVALNMLLECGFDPTLADGNGNLPIHGPGRNSTGGGHSSSDGEQNTNTSTLLDHGADPYSKDKYGCMPLWTAAYLGLDHEVKSLLKHGVNPDGLDQNGKSDPAFSLEELEKLETENLSRHPRGGHHETELIHRVGTTPLCIAACMNRDNAVRTLLAYGANPDIKNQNGDTPLHIAVLNKNAYLVTDLIEKGASVDIRDKDGQTAFWAALRICKSFMIQSFFDAGARIENIDSKGIHPVFRALEYGHPDYRSYELLPPCIVDTGQWSTLEYQHEWAHRCYCCPLSSEEDQCHLVVGWFLDRGVDVNTRDLLGRTMLHQTVFQNCERSVRVLLQKGADPMAKDSFGQTPLHMACSDKWDCSKKVFNMLLEAGCDPNSKDENGDTPLHISARSAYVVGVRILRKDGRADFLERNNRGNTPMHEAMRGQANPDSIEKTIWELRRAGTDLNLVNNLGQTVWDLARHDPDMGDWRADTLSEDLPEEDRGCGLYCKCEKESNEHPPTQPSWRI